MMFNCAELVTQQLRKFRATFASVVVASSCAKGRCLTENCLGSFVADGVCITADGKRRQLAVNYQRQKASYCDTFVAAFCRYLLPRFYPGFFLKPELRRWCLGANASRCRQDEREKSAWNACSGMFPSTLGQRIGVPSCARIRVSIVCRRPAYQDIPRPVSLCGPS